MLIPTTMIQAFGLMKLIEDKFNSQCRQGKQPLNKPQGSQDAQKPTRSFQIKRLNQKEMNEHRAKDISYNYDEKYTPSHKCTTQRLYFFDVDIYEDFKDETIVKEETNEPKPTEEEVPIISYCSLTGITTPQTMKVYEYFKKYSLIILLDFEVHIISLTLMLPNRLTILYTLKISLK